MDSSVLLAHLFAEARRPDGAIWTERLVSSRLIKYEVLNRLHARRLGGAAFDAAVSLVRSMYLLDLAPDVLARAREPFPRPIRTLDGLHLASLMYLRRTERDVQLAT
nr:PIN domain-containing protein [Enterovirga sp. DB1703]